MRPIALLQKAVDAIYEESLEGCRDLDKITEEHLQWMKEFEACVLATLDPNATSPTPKAIMLQFHEKHQARLTEIRREFERKRAELSTELERKSQKRLEDAQRLDTEKRENHIKKRFVSTTPVKSRGGFAIPAPRVPSARTKSKKSTRTAFKLVRTPVAIRTRPGDPRHSTLAAAPSELRSKSLTGRKRKRNAESDNSIAKPQVIHEEKEVDPNDSCMNRFEAPSSPGPARKRVRLTQNSEFKQRSSARLPHKAKRTQPSDLQSDPHTQNEEEKQSTEMDVDDDDEQKTETDSSETEDERMTEADPQLQHKRIDADEKQPTTPKRENNKTVKTRQSARATRTRPNLTQQKRPSPMDVDEIEPKQAKRKPKPPPSKPSNIVSSFGTSFGLAALTRSSTESKETSQSSGFSSNIITGMSSFIPGFMKRQEEAKQAEKKKLRIPALEKARRKREEDLRKEKQRAEKRAKLRGENPDGGKGTSKSQLSKADQRRQQVLDRKAKIDAQQEQKRLEKQNQRKKHQPKPARKPRQPNPRKAPTLNRKQIQRPVPKHPCPELAMKKNKNDSNRWISSKDLKTKKPSPDITNQRQPFQSISNLNTSQPRQGAPGKRLAVSELSKPAMRRKTAGNTNTNNDNTIANLQRKRLSKSLSKDRVEPRTVETIQEEMKERRRKLREFVSRIPSHLRDESKGYELSDYDSDFSDSDLDESNCDKHIPAWAKKQNLGSLVRAQAIIDPDLVFGKMQFMSIDLTQTFRAYPAKERYRKRTQSGDWSRDKLRHQEELKYKGVMGWR